MRPAIRYIWRISRPIRIRWFIPGVTAVVAIPALVAIILLISTMGPAAQATPSTVAGSTPSPEVHTVIRLNNPELHPEQLAHDPGRNGIWFWTSQQDRGTTFNNRVYFYNIGLGRLSSWPIYSGDWSSLLHAGLAVAPNGNVWVGWNHNLVEFHPSDGTYVRYVLPAQPRYPLPAAVIRDLPADLGITDLAVARDGTVWIARYAALSLTTFSPASRAFSEYPLPARAGDPAKLAIGPDGHIFFITNLSADHPGYGAEKVGDYDPQTHTAVIVPHGALSLAVTPHGDIYVGLSARGFGLSRLTAAGRASAAAQGRAPVFQDQVIPFDVDDRALAADMRGRVWIALGGRPQIAVLDPITGQIQRYQYAAPAITSWPAQDFLPGVHPATPPPGAVWLSHIIAMATDGQGHLWYVRAGSDSIEEVIA